MTNLTSTAWKALDTLRGTHGIEASIGELVRLAYLRMCEPQTWRAIELGIDVNTSVKQLPSHSPGRVSHGPWPADPQPLRQAVDIICSLPISELPGFTEVILARWDALGRAGAAHQSDRWINSALVALGDPSGHAVHDPAVGIGGTLLAAAKHGAEQLSGTDISETSVAIATMRLAIHGHGADIRLRNSMDSTEAAPVHAFGRVLTDPPLGSEITAAQAEQLGTSRRRPEVAWLEVIHRTLTNDGRAVVRIPLRSWTNKERRNEILHRFNVESVTILPMRRKIGFGTVLISICGARPPRDLLLINLDSLLLEPSKARPDRDLESVRSLREIIDTWRRYGRICTKPHIAVSADRSEDLLSTPLALFADAPAKTPKRPSLEKRLLTHLNVHRFKSFRGNSRIPLAPLTLIFGPNSSGKSSLIQSLLLLAQSHRLGYLSANGELAQMGSLKSLANVTENNGTSVGFEFGAPLTWPDPEGSVHPALPRSFLVTFGGTPDARTTTEFRIGEEAVFRTEMSDEGWVFDGANLASWAPLLADSREGLVRMGSAGELEGLRLTHRPHLVQSMRTWPPSAFRVHGDNFAPSGLAVDERYLAGGDPGASHLTQRIALAIGSISGEMGKVLGELRHLGPARPAPRRFQRLDDDEMVSFLFDNGSSLEQVNSWMAKLAIPYSLEILPLRPSIEVPAVGDVVAVLVRDKRSGAHVSMADVGYGVSQVLPIITECVRSQNRVICVEQPELHLHPRLQANLADLLIETTQEQGAGNQVIAETHSEHILLRIQRSIREERVSPNDVSILYVDQEDDGGARARRLRLASDGSFLDPWPGGFFDDSIEDILGGWE